MPLTDLMFRTTRVASLGVQNAIGVVRPHPAVNGDQRTHAFTHARATLAITPNGGTMNLSIVPDVNGDVVYIPWGLGEIHSVHIPQAELANISLFVTAQMQGCQLVVNKMDDGSYKFHHGNSLQSPTAQDSATRPTFQTPAALTDLTRLSDLGRPLVADPVQIQLTGTLSKADYFAGVQRRLDQKFANGRTGINYARPEHVSFTYVVAFNLGAQWSVWYQTSSQFFYRRPTKAIFRKKVVDPSAGQNIEFIEAREAFRI
ncbi:hypothetical protein [Piscinibacter gummiphilus]|uniref:Uncharacterized protein n=1 Tax=Piscinibacter gummiphilus TaxID=946333 RepID=A0A1W6LA30_9BURK|nr:hypothetical protein [Piscinibacter gummiphilus]ARN21037.1 hypothetical protein A4W93_14670 [Piscinibacter gummiphilus]ATU65712.1 hypothetical protein CPZ87_14750 [Piscinibacter gummiphilus]GLS93576.1 hypothetical protein GCM10007918_08670 [Piscinibacter gummiphilus]